MWGMAKRWLDGGALPDDPELAQDLTGVEFGYDARSAIQLESKQDMKKRGLLSPDIGDAFALTFAWPLHPEFDHSHDTRARPPFVCGAPLGDYDVVEAWDREWAAMDDEELYDSENGRWR
jgi:hypothetical protein